ncbi:hypothetical protein CDL15_Pgr025835 [Punica granatum]|uniref:Uncharacterized protein n=1 Tax=Punica granatum TaxID=22663 RepID=A0A218WBH2_PUNGR|nr:hypothetical protein CDL15_Pgr025835 [Punica granatum]PKI39601.1 hypothetical protein CRG98_040071 [Punica granatum]
MQREIVSGKSGMRNAVNRFLERFPLDGIPERKSKRKEGSRLPIGDPDSSTEVAGTHRGLREPQWRGRGRQLEALILDQPRIPNRRSLVDSGSRPPSRWYPPWVPATSTDGSGSPIGCPDPSFPFDFLSGLK